MDIRRQEVRDWERPPGKQCKHADATHLKEQEVWLCKKCGEVLKNDPDDLSYLDYDDALCDYYEVRDQVPKQGEEK